MSRHFPKSSSLIRRTGIASPKLTIYIICEGYTEKDYFEKFSRKRKASIVEVLPSAKGGAIRPLIDKVIAKEKELKAKAKKSKDSFDSEYMVWGVPDVDEHPKLKEAMNLAKEHNLNIALSNPCFEIWGIFHFEDHDANIHRHDAQRKLHTLMPSYHHKNNPYFDIERLDPLYQKNAVKYAERSLIRRAEEDNPNGNPSTSVHKLLAVIVSGKKDENAKSA